MLMIVSTTCRLEASGSRWSSVLLHETTTEVRNADARSRMSPLILDDGVEVAAFKLLLPLQERQLEQTRGSRDHAAHLLHQLTGPYERAPRRQHVVDHEHALLFLHGVLVDFHRVLAVFEIVALGDRLPRKLILLPDRDKADLEPRRHRRAEKKT